MDIVQKYSTAGNRCQAAFWSPCWHNADRCRQMIRIIPTKNFLYGIRKKCRHLSASVGIRSNCGRRALDKTARAVLD